MSISKRLVRKVLRTIDPDLEEKLVDQYHFDQLKREPPEFIWKALKSAPYARLDSGLAHVGNEMFVFGGFLWG